MRYIDIHCHTSRAKGLSRPNGTRYPRPDEFVAMLDERGIDKAVALSTVSPECRYAIVTPEEVQSIHEEYPDRIIPFCNIDPRYLTNSTDADFTPILEYYKSAGFRGVGEYIPNLPMDHDLNMNVFEHVERVGLPLTFHLAPRLGGFYGCQDDLGLPRLEHVLRTYPSLKLLAHSQVFWAEMSADVTEETRSGYPNGPVTPGRVVELMRTYPNLLGDLSAGSGFNAISRDPEFGYGFLTEFQDRLFFGTDLANIPQDTPIVEYFDRMRAERTVSPDVIEKVSWQNAAALLGV